MQNPSFSGHVFGGYGEPMHSPRLCLPHGVVSASLPVSASQACSNRWSRNNTPISVRPTRWARESKAKKGEAVMHSNLLTNVQHSNLFTNVQHTSLLTNVQRTSSVANGCLAAATKHLRRDRVLSHAKCNLLVACNTLEHAK